MDNSRPMGPTDFTEWEVPGDLMEAERIYPYRPKHEFYGFSDDEATEQAIDNDRMMTNALRRAFIAGRASIRMFTRPSHGG